MKGIRRLAQELDISIGTVSRALNGKPDVNEQTRQRVLAAAASMVLFEVGVYPPQHGVGWVEPANVVFAVAGVDPALAC